MNNKKLKSVIATLLMLPLLIIGGCDLVDPTQVHNPSITSNNLLEDASGGAEPLIVGLEYAFSNAVRKTAVYTEVVSDNYMNTGTFFSTIIDKPANIAPNEQYLNDDREIYFRLQNLHALATFGLSTVIPSDALATDAQKAKVHFFKGMALVMLAENFAAFPVEEGGAMVKAVDALKIAVEDLKTSYQLDPGGENGNNCKLALARAYRLMGDKINAANSANEALAMSQDYVYFGQYDTQNLINDIWTFTINRTDDDFQPLPRLDFLDPKCPSKDAPIPALKSEEAYLILAEAAISNSDLSEAKRQMINAIDLADKRDAVVYTDGDKRRGRPDDNSFKSKSDANAPAVGDLIYKRNGSAVTVHPVSYTSLTADYINSLASVEDHYYALYLLRQHIFFSEGRRMSDLGIRLPVMQREIDSNPHVNFGDYGTIVIIPAFIPQGAGMDEFTIDENTKVVTMSYDMNQLVARNIGLVGPFAK